MFGDFNNAIFNRKTSINAKRFDRAHLFNAFDEFALIELEK